MKDFVATAEAATGGHYSKSCQFKYNWSPEEALGRHIDKGRFLSRAKSVSDDGEKMAEEKESDTGSSS